MGEDTGAAGDKQKYVWGKCAVWRLKIRRIRPYNILQAGIIGMFIALGEFFSSCDPRSQLFINTITEKDSETEDFLHCSGLYNIIYRSLHGSSESIHHRFSTHPCTY